MSSTAAPALVDAHVAVARPGRANVVETKRSGLPTTGVSVTESAVRSACTCEKHRPSPLPSADSTDVGTPACSRSVPSAAELPPPPPPPPPPPAAASSVYAIEKEAAMTPLTPTTYTQPAQ